MRSGIRSSSNPAHQVADEGSADRHHEKREQTSFRLLVETVKDYAIFMLDPKGVVTTWNAGAKRIKGYTAEEIIGKHFSCFYPEEDVNAGKCEYELEAALAEGRFEDEGWRRRKDGTMFWANVVFTAIHDEGGTLVGFAKVTRDLTERREREQEKLRLAQAQEANRVKDEFLATVSHELRTPLNAILGWSSLLLSRAKDPEVAKGLVTIRRNAQAQTRLIEDLLDVSRIVTGKFILDLRATDLASVVREVVDAIRPNAEAMGLKLFVERLDEPAVLVGDPVRLQQVVWNILSNAVKFTAAGGSIYIRLEQDGPMIRLWIRDTGRGIDPEFLPHVFERFRQSDASTTRKFGGLGLGLAIVHSIVDLHGGKIDVESPGLGKGATFTVQLPVRVLVPAEESGTSARSEPEINRLDGLRVLVLDDEPDARELVALLLSERGAVVQTSTSVLDARQQIDTFRPHVIISDIGMSHEDGYAFVRELRSRPRQQGGAIPAIALTAYAGPADRRRSFEAGFNNYLTKPVDAHELVSVVWNLAKVSG